MSFLFQSMGVFSKNNPFGIYALRRAILFRGLEIFVILKRNIQENNLISIGDLNSISEVFRGWKRRLLSNNSLLTICLPFRRYLFHVGLPLRNLQENRLNESCPFLFEMLRLKILIQRVQ